MRKCYLLGATAVTVLSLVALIAATALADVPGGEPAFWLVKGVALANGEANGLAQDIEGEITSVHLSATVMRCSFLLEGSVYNEAAGGFGLITKVWSLGTGQVEISLGGNALKCEAASGFCEKTTDVEVWPDNLPWLVTLILMTLNSKEEAAELFLILFSADPTNLPAYEVLCLVFAIAVEELCQGETSAIFALSAGVMIATFFESELVAEKLEGSCGTNPPTNEEQLVAGTETWSLVNGEELDPSSTR
jgi:hypothetical protein